MIVFAITVGSVALFVYLFMFSEFSDWPYRIPRMIKTNKKVVAITFDDGPNPPYTDSILDFLSANNVRATFFVVGKCSEKHPGLLNRMLKDGHQIANHSQSHKFSNYLRSLDFSLEIEKSQNTIKKITGNKPRYIRLPWLFRTPLIVKYIRSRKLNLVGGRFCHPLEILQINPAKIADRAFKIIKPGSIIIFHDGFDSRGGDRSKTVEAVKILIPKLRESGYQFVTVAELAGSRAYK
ncbi:MAG TPA: polysaccharide deacetylase family protein [Candidatus Saccharibacteria bacterium]|jgi:peptidoglycan/xylan/chitin deacetylase (PgdA/CDA1 family)|nr:polysaccharide deacetylase family protein [Candidatus Saccharibacteria bacterium]